MPSQAEAMQQALLGDSYRGKLAEEGGERAGAVGRKPASQKEKAHNERDLTGRKHLQGEKGSLQRGRGERGGEGGREREEGRGGEGRAEGRGGEGRGGQRGGERGGEGRGEGRGGEL
jgi:ribonuclease G